MVKYVAHKFVNSHFGHIFSNAEAKELQNCLITIFVFINKVNSQAFFYRSLLFFPVKLVSSCSQVMKHTRGKLGKLMLSSVVEFVSNRCALSSIRQNRG